MKIPSKLKQIYLTLNFLLSNPDYNNAQKEKSAEFHRQKCLQQ